ncbi:MAG: BMP family ABC transporter substrate-binding protein [Candidatus Protistobacter heckmanni]|nr:BMP family ABC transporter substrate-binding protein [Candidatus Protistobacter heckmanni]
MKFNRRIVLAVAAAALALAGCGQKEEVAPVPKAEPLKVAFVYVGPVGDAGWTFAHDSGRKAVEAKFGDKVKTTFVESVPESAADAERVFRDLASQGNKIIFGTTFGYMEAMLKVAKDFPDVKFEHATGFKSADNMAQYDARNYEGAYMAGLIAGKVSKSGKLGVVASIPIPEVIRNIDAFTMGAQISNPKIKTKVVWINKWFDPGKEREAATSLISQGVDVLMQNTDSPATLQTAQEKGKFAFGWDSDMSKFGGKAHLASAVINWGGYYVQEVEKVLNNQWKTGFAWGGVKDGMIDIVTLNATLGNDVKELVEEKKKGLADGSFAIWKGPLKDNTGKVVLEKDKVADDDFLHNVTFYVDGVEGKVPN